ncbi:MAG: hypothetical protein CVU05_15270 [Bacteroidetes bacterium HGW-Bacteroidetes-21]|jgi:hypothetical protein|nr:MAG: hypothetical protein CVU05_15270 [Bacteroidetes bacterium HGW-Bacteroidetes-21]
MKTTSFILLLSGIVLSSTVFAQIRAIENGSDHTSAYLNKDKATTVVELTLTNFQNQETVVVNLPSGNNLQLIQQYSCVTGSVSLLSIPGYTYLGFLPYTSPALTSEISYWVTWGSLSTMVNVVIQTTDINENNTLISGSEFSVYPTLASDYLYITSENKTAFEIFDINGNIISRTKEKTINVSELKPGLYYIRNEKSVKKFFKN